MPPYGIIYTDNAYSLEQSVSIWQKKFGVMKISLLIKIDLIINLLIAVIYFAAAFFLKDATYLYSYFIQFIATTVLVYSVMKTTNVKNLASQCRQKTDIQIVFYDDRLVVTMPYSKSEYYYDELVYCCEKNGTVTMVVDEAIAPLSVNSASVKKGSYSRVCEILADRLGNRFISSEVAG